MQIREIEAKRILTKQRGGFLTQGQYPYTHALSWAAGCGFGNIYCGAYCYARTLPNWLYNKEPGEDWGDAVIFKANAPDLLASELAKSRNRQQLRIFMSSVTDPYQPIERRYRLTRQCLEVFAEYDDLDLLVIQTRSPMLTDDLDLMAQIPYLWVSMTLETDRGDLPYGPNLKFIEQRYAAVQATVAAGIKTQITVSPCLPFSDNFADMLIQSGAARIVVDSFVDGDGSAGDRTAGSPFAKQAGYDWRDTQQPRDLYDALSAAGINTGWSAEGFNGIPPRTRQSLL
ncbi:MAG: SPL family radical SAM protein [Aggregatilineales bacterium]